MGLAGVDGNGQSELVECIAGLRTPTGGHVEVGGVDITGAGVRDALAAGVGHIAEDRHRRGLILDFTLAENLALREYKRESRWGCSRRSGCGAWPRRCSSSTTCAAAPRTRPPARCPAATSRSA